MKKSLLIQNSLLSDVVMDIQYQPLKRYYQPKPLQARSLMQQKSMVQHLMSQKWPGR